MFSKKLLYTIVAVLSMALIGLILIQTYWIRNAYKTEEEQYKQDVNQALANVAEKLDKEQYSEDLMEVVTESVMDDVSGKISVSSKVIQRNFKIVDSLVETNGDTTLMRVISGLAKDSASGITAEAILTKESRLSDSLAVLNLVDNHFNLSHHVPKITQNDLLNRIHVISDLLLKALDPKSYQPAETRIDLSVLDSMIQTELENFGIAPEYRYSITDGEGKVFDFSEQSNARFNPKLRTSEFSQYLFPGDLSRFKAENVVLLLDIEGKSQHLFSKIWWIFVLSVGFILIIIFAFFYTVSTINKQKKLSLIKNDFINNMTHELKTPISTISLACEALSDPDFNQGQPLNNTYVNMIKDENVRLGVLVDRVLQSAVIEKGNLTLKKETVDLHALILQVSGKFNFQVERNGGKLNLDLSAKHYDIAGDPVHLTNLLYNLLDNACKYSKDATQISIATNSSNTDVVLTVADKGIGISKEHQKKIFEKLYRVPTGNVHDVKGFGLGLSYVKAIVEKHNGTIELKSVLDKGSTFVLKFPINHENA